MRTVFRCGLRSVVLLMAAAFGAPRAALARVASPPSESPAVYELVLTAALDRVPVQYRSIYEPHRQAILTCATGGGAGRFAPSPVLTRAESHYLMLDAACTEPAAAARLKAARAFPHEAQPAEKLLTEHGQREGGRLPWALAEQCEALTAAIRGRNEPETARLAGAVVHLAVDAGLPFNTTTQHLGPTASQFVLPEGAPAEPFVDCANARGRTQDALIRRHRALLTVALADSQRICSPTESVVDDALHEMIRASAALDALLEADRLLVERWGLRDGEAFVAIAEPFLTELDGRCLPLVTARLDAAACFSAALLVQCAAAANGDAAVSTLATASKGDKSKSPPAPPKSEGSAALPPASSGAVGAPAGSTSKPAPAPAATVFIGSKNSKKFHRPTCRWAESIKEDNRVTFASAAAAVTAGREPCSTCEPKD
ncbi:MAG: hypothetical protein IT449_15150 [Phycisphaerales bacterium]|nr:hypothetical protein [Phycisphaerales bacterium]